MVYRWLRIQVPPSALQCIALADGRNAFAAANDRALRCSLSYSRGYYATGNRVKRRDFITLLSGLAAAWPVAARAQQPTSLPTVGFLGAGSPTTTDVWVSAFMSRLRELGWIEGRNIKVDVRWAEGRNDRSAEIAAEFVRLKVDVIVTYSSEHTQIAKQATSTIPIVFALAADPVGSGLVANLARPGGNVTGLSAQNVDLTGKRFELLREIVPRTLSDGPAQPTHGRVTGSSRNVRHEQNHTYLEASGAPIDPTPCAGADCPRSL
jgi:hypothetical protein